MLQKTDTRYGFITQKYIRFRYMCLKSVYNFCFVSLWNWKITVDDDVIVKKMSVIEVIFILCWKIIYIFIFTIRLM